MITNAYKPIRCCLLALLLLALISPLGAQEADTTQVRIEARVLEWEKADSFDFAFAANYTPGPDALSSIVRGADLTVPSGLANGTRLFFEGMNFGGGTIDGVVEMLEEWGNVKVLHQPSIILKAQHIGEPAPEAPLNLPGLDKQTAYQAKLTNDTRIPYETTQAIGARLASVTEYQNSGVTLNVSVKNIDSDLVTLDLNTNVKDLTGFISIGLNEQNEPMRVPTFNERSIQNRIAVPDRSVFIAGLMKITAETQRKEGIPWIGELPFLDWLISSRSNAKTDRELVFLVKPEILYPKNSLLTSTDPAQLMGADPIQ